MSVSSYNSVNTFNDVTSSQFVNYFNIDYYTFRHVINKANLIEVRDYPDQQCNNIPLPNLSKSGQYKNTNLQLNYMQQNNKSQMEESVQYFKQVQIPTQQSTMNNQNINQLQQSKRQLDTNQKNISETLKAIQDDQVFMGQYGQQLKDIQHKNQILWQQNQKLLQELENVKTQINSKEQQQIALKASTFMQDFDQYKQEITKINNDLEYLKKSRKSQQDNVFLQSITSQKNIPSEQQKTQRDEQINFLLQKIDYLEKRVGQNNSDQHNCSNCKTCQQKDKTIQYLKQFLDDSPLQTNIQNQTNPKQSFNRQYTIQQNNQQNNSIRHSYSQANFSLTMKQNFQNDEYGSFKEGTTVVEKDGQRYPRGTSIRRYRNNEGNRVTEIRTPPKLQSTYIDNEKRYNFEQKYPINQSTNQYHTQQPQRYSITHSQNVQTDISRPKVTYIKYDGTRQSYIGNSTLQNQSNANNLINSSRRSSTFEDYYKVQNGIRTSQVINQVTNSKENIQHDEYGMNTQQSAKQSQQNSELFSNKDGKTSDKQVENLGMMSFGFNNFKQQNNLNFYGSKKMIKPNNQSEVNNEESKNPTEEDLHNQSDDIMNIIQTKTLNRKNKYGQN